MSIVFNGKFFSNEQDLLDDQEFSALNESEKEYLLALFRGQEPPARPVVPRSVTARQFRSALILQNINLSQVESAINSLQSPQKELAMVAWEYSNEFERDNVWLNSLAPLLGFNQQMLDDLFIFASTL